MLFTSSEFLFFFPCVVLVHALWPARTRWGVLLVASALFYAFAFPRYLAVLGALVVVDWLAALAIERSEGSARTLWLGASLAANLGFLVAFKYLAFAAATLTTALGLFSVRASLAPPLWPIPIGLSFHVFQSMAYTIEVYRRRFRAERHPGIYALYVLFFPQLVAGPIERPEALLPQLRAPRPFDENAAVSGLRRMLLGYVKKIVVADRLAVFVDAVYARPQERGGLTLLIATYAFAFQIWLDFSGYVDIAVGAARVLGYDLHENFDRPYAATSIRDFWRRWHITLSGWFRDFVYFPLGGARTDALRTGRNILVVFLLSGLWHGAAWTFVLWGALHGLLVLLERTAVRVLARLSPGPPRQQTRWGDGFRMFITFNLIALTWILFRANSVEDAVEVVRGITTRMGRATGLSGAPPMRPLLIGVSMAVAMFILEIPSVRAALVDRLLMAQRAVRWCAYYAIVLLLVFGGLHGGRPFIYFQF